eukprot:1146811-Pelagomonas_calceolata.AAC.2
MAQPHEFAAEPIISIQQRLCMQRIHAASKNTHSSTTTAQTEPIRQLTPLLLKPSHSPSAR